MWLRNGSNARPRMRTLATPAIERRRICARSQYRTDGQRRSRSEIKTLLRRFTDFEEPVKNSSRTLALWQISTQHLVSLGSLSRCLPHLGIGPRMSFSQILLLIVSAVMFFYIGYAMFKPEKF